MRDKSKTSDAAPDAEEQTNGEESVVLNISETGDIVAVDEENQAQGQEVAPSSGNLLEQAFVEAVEHLQEGTTIVQTSEGIQEGTTVLQVEGLEDGTTAVLEDGSTGIQVSEQQEGNGATVVETSEQLEDGTTAVQYAIADGVHGEARIVTADELEAQNIRLVSAETGAEIQTVQGIVQSQHEQEPQQQQQQSLLKPGIAQLLSSGKKVTPPSTVKLISDSGNSAPIGSSQNPIRIVQQGEYCVCVCVFNFPHIIFTK